MTTAVKALFFDVFGTLVDWRSSIAREAETLLKPLGPRRSACGRLMSHGQTSTARVVAKARRASQSILR